MVNPATPITNKKASATTEASASAKESNNPVLMNAMRDLLLRGEYSDMTITCQGFRFCVHRAILCSQSAFFKAAMNGSFEEGITKTIDLPDDDPETIERVLAFLYVGDYSPKEHLLDLSTRLLQPDKAKRESPESSQAPLVAAEDKSTSSNSNRTITSEGYNHLDVYIAADKFALDALKSLASNRLRAWCNDNWQSVAFRKLVQHATSMNPEPEWDIYLILGKAISSHAGRYVENGTKVPEIFKVSPRISAIALWYLAREKMFANKSKRK